MLKVTARSGLGPGRIWSQNAPLQPCRYHRGTKTGRQARRSATAGHERPGSGHPLSDALGDAINGTFVVFDGGVRQKRWRHKGGRRLCDHLLTAAKSSAVAESVQERRSASCFPGAASLSMLGVSEERSAMYHRKAELQTG